MEHRYCPDFGRPAIHPETMVRALLICSIYNIASFRRLCSAISENIAYRWFCFLTIDDPAFDHSTITHFINRIGREGFSEVFEGLNQELLRMGLLSAELYVDSSMVKANVNSYGLSRMTTIIILSCATGDERDDAIIIPAPDGVPGDSAGVGKGQGTKQPELPRGVPSAPSTWRSTRSGLTDLKAKPPLDQRGFANQMGG